LGSRYTDYVVVLSVFFVLKPYLANACGAEWLDADCFAVGHDQFCMRINRLSSAADKPMVPFSFALVECDTKFKWFFLLYPIIYNYSQVSKTSRILVKEV